MFGQEQHFCSCPYCGESITVLIDTSIDEQSYYEDCQVCCAPILFSVLIFEDQIVVDLKTDAD
ncbi:MAG: CPXCG motif-containing cysteine-rich protein [Methylococcaceae bacterium]|jgi:hypothetical protein